MKTIPMMSLTLGGTVCLAPAKKTLLKATSKTTTRHLAVQIRKTIIEVLMVEH